MMNGRWIEVHEVAPDADTLLRGDSNTGNREVDDTATEEAAAPLTALDAEGGRTTDPVRMDMREMGTVELLTRAGAIAIAKRIEAGLNPMTPSLASLPRPVQLLLEDWGLHKAGKKRLDKTGAGLKDGLDDEPEPPAARPDARREEKEWG